MLGKGGAVVVVFPYFARVGVLSIARGCTNRVEGARGVRRAIRGIYLGASVSRAVFSFRAEHTRGAALRVIVRIAKRAWWACWWCVAELIFADGTDMLAWVSGVTLGVFADSRIATVADSRASLPGVRRGL